MRAGGYTPGDRGPCGKCGRQLVRASKALGDDPSSYGTQGRVEAIGNGLPEDDWDSGDRLLVRKADGHCVYLADDLTHCRIYDRRPHACRAFPCDPMECRVLLEIANA